MNINEVSHDDQEQRQSSYVSTGASEISEHIRTTDVDEILKT